jgi:hypothetical protein
LTRIVDALNWDVIGVVVAAWLVYAFSTPGTIGHELLAP